MAADMMETPSKQANLFTHDDLFMEVRQSFKDQEQAAKRDLLLDTGTFAFIARSALFEQVTMLVITLNSIWLMIDVDYNHETLLYKAEPVFQIGEHSFCLFFSAEWFVRFMAFRSKKEGFKDLWFLFDTVLVVMMVFETWVMNVFAAITSGSGSARTGSLSILRLLRLLRLTRMAKLMRVVPELMILVKALLASARAVSLTLFLLMIVIYVHAIIFVQLLPETEAWEDTFGSVPMAMYTLLIEGIFPDQGGMAYALGDERWYLAALFFVFIASSTLTLINMLIGIICEVLSAAAMAERNRSDVDLVERRLWYALKAGNVDEDHDGLISKAEFLGILKNDQVVKALRQVGVNEFDLLNQTESVFDGDIEEEVDATDGGGIALRRVEKRLTFPEFMEVILQLRGGNPATVRDVSELRRYMHKRMTAIEGRLAPFLMGSMCSLASEVPSPVAGGRVVENVQEKPWPPSSPPPALPPDMSVNPPRATDVPDLMVDTPAAQVPRDPETVAELMGLQQRMARMEGLMHRLAQSQSLILERLTPAPPGNTMELQLANANVVADSCTPVVAAPGGGGRSSQPRAAGSEWARQNVQLTAGGTPWGFIDCTNIGRVPPVSQSSPGLPG